MKYRKQKYSSCQLISAINARIYLGLSDITNDFFEYLVNLVKCRYGGAINIEKSYPLLGLSSIDGKYNYEWIKKNLPIDIAYHDKKRGFHSALIVEVKNKVLKLINAYKEDFTFQELKKLLPKQSYNQKFRSFKLL